MSFSFVICVSTSENIVIRQIIVRIPTHLLRFVHVTCVLSSSDLTSGRMVLGMCYCTVRFQDWILKWRFRTQDLE